MSNIDLLSLKSMLRSVVVSSPTQVNLSSLVRDYRNLVGEPLPIHQFGYNDALTFLKEMCSDCFQGEPSNPVLTLIVPKSLQYINRCVQNQKVTNAKKMIRKRTSIPDRSVGIPEGGGAAKFDNESCRSSWSHVCSYTERLQLDTLPEPRDIHPLTPHNHSSTHSSNGSSTKRSQLEVLKEEIHAIIKDSKDGVWCKDLVMRYRERYGTVPELTRFGYTSIVSLVQTLSERLRITRYTGRGDMFLQDAAAAPPPPPEIVPETCRCPTNARRPCDAPARDHASRAARDEDALPGVPYAPDVFPIDCLQFGESVPQADISSLQPGHNIDVIVGEVYSPSHFWLIRLGPDHEIAMEELVHEMTEYFQSEEGRKRYLAKAALRVGQFCAAFYNCNWHRAIIIELLDGEELVKVRHVDYGTVRTVPAATLRPFLRRWARLPVQAIRARQAGVRPAGGAGRWSQAASEYFLHLVDDRSLIASIVAINAKEATLEVFLVDTSQEEDDDFARDLVRAGFADERRDSALRSNDSYLYPVFSALESGATPNFAEIQRYLRDGITVEYVPSYRRHVPSALSTFEPTDTPGLPSPSATRIPIIRSVQTICNALSTTLPSTSKPAPAATPTLTPAATPTLSPTSTPTFAPAATPTLSPTGTPTLSPAATPTLSPTGTPTLSPTATPTLMLTTSSVARLTVTPASIPTATPKPIVTTALLPTASHAPKPTVTPAPIPIATNAPKPAITLAPIPTSINVPKPTVTSVTIPTATLAPKPTVTPAPRPVVTPAPRPVVTPVLRPNTKPTPGPITTLPPQSNITHAPRWPVPDPGRSFHPPAMLQPYDMPQAYGMPPPRYVTPPPPPYSMPQPPYGVPPPPPPPYNMYGFPPPLPPHGMMPPPFRMPLPPHSMAWYEGAGAGTDVAVGGGDMLLSAVNDWAMYEQLTATAHWFKIAAMRHARLAAAAQPPSPMLLSHHSFTSDQSSRF